MDGWMDFLQGNPLTNNEYSSTRKQCTEVGHFAVYF